MTRNTARTRYLKFECLEARQLLAIDGLYFTAGTSRNLSDLRLRGDSDIVTLLTEGDTLTVDFGMANFGSGMFLDVIDSFFGVTYDTATAADVTWAEIDIRALGAIPLIGLRGSDGDAQIIVVVSNANVGILQITGQGCSGTVTFNGNTARAVRAYPCQRQTTQTHFSLSPRLTAVPAKPKSAPWLFAVCCCVLVHVTPNPACPTPRSTPQQAEDENKATR